MVKRREKQRGNRLMYLCEYVSTNAVSEQMIQYLVEWNEMESNRFLQVCSFSSCCSIQSPSLGFHVFIHSVASYDHMR